MSASQHRLVVVIDACDEGPRLRSSLPKLAHEIAGRTLFEHGLDTARALEPGLVVALLPGRGDDVLPPRVRGASDLCAVDLRRDTDVASLPLGDHDAVAVMAGDRPLLRPHSARATLEQHERAASALTIAIAPLPGGRPAAGHLEVRSDERELVEQLAPSEEGDLRSQVAAGVFCCDGRWLREQWQRGAEVRRARTFEERLCALFARARAEGLSVRGVQTATGVEVDRVDTRIDLARIEATTRERMRSELMLGGVTLIDPATVYVEAGVSIAEDVVIHPHTFIEGDTAIGRGCELGPSSVIRDANVAEGCRVELSHVEGATLGAGVRVGPFARVRAGTRLGARVVVGNFAELKNATLGEDSRSRHLSFIGDARIGADVNVGAGTVTCNYDGQRKHQTVIDDGAFIGSGTMLVAPVEVGRKARTGAGAVVTRDVAAGRLVYGVPARERREDGSDSDA